MASKINKVLTNQTQILSIEELANVSASLSAILGQGSGGEQCASAWLPTVTEDGDISWTLTSATTAPATANIMGPAGPSGAKGEQGPSGTNGKDAPIPEFRINDSNAHWEWKYTSASNWTDLNVVASGTVGPQGVQGPSGAKGDTGAKGADATPLTATTATIAGGTQVTINYTSGGDPLAQFNVLSGAQGANGISPTVELTEIHDSEYPQGGWNVKITDAEHQSGQTFQIFNGIDGKGATVDLVEGNGIQITREAGTTNYTIGVSADYALKTYVDTASAEALSQAKSWVNQQNFATSAGLAANTRYEMTNAGWTSAIKIQVDPEPPTANDGILHIILES